MKEASGELSMTVLVIVAAVALITFVGTFVMPMVSDYISDSFEEMKEAGESINK